VWCGGCRWGACAVGFGPLAGLAIAGLDGELRRHNIFCVHWLRNHVGSLYLPLFASKLVQLFEVAVGDIRRIGSTEDAHLELLCFRISGRELGARGLDCLPYKVSTRIL